MHASELEEFLSTLPDPESFAGKNIYVWGIGSLTSMYQEGFAREQSLKICGYTVSKGYEVSNYTHRGGGKYTERNYSLLKK